MACELLSERLCRARFDVLASVVTSDNILRSVSECCPEVAIISADLQDERLGGFKALREVHSAHAAVRTIMLLGERDQDLVISAFRGGARGVFFRAEPFNVLTKCIRAVHEGQVWASSKDMELILGALVSAAPLRKINGNGSRSLTRREDQVASFVAQGLTNREIAQKMFLSEHTIKNYLFRIFDKLNISNRVELVLYSNSKENAA